MVKKRQDLNNLFYEDKPLFGLDVGHDMIRVIQFDMQHKVPKLVGYGTIGFDPSAIVNGVIVDPEIIAKSAYKLFSKELIGDISTKRVAVSLPAAKAFTNALQLPKMHPKDIEEAIKTESQQYLPTDNTEELYMDYTKLRENEDGIEVFVVAIPKKIVDSHLTLTKMLGLETVLMDTAIGASARLFTYDAQSDVPAVLVDFGANSTDITVYNHGLVVTGTVGLGGDDITTLISRILKVTEKEATMLKSNYGLSFSEVQKKITLAIEPSLELILKEIRRTIRYYEQRYPKDPPIGQVIIMGGGANMPGLNDYLTAKLRLAVRTISLESHIDFAHLHPFYSADRMSFVTAAGLALTKPEDVFE